MDALPPTIESNPRRELTLGLIALVGSLAPAIAAIAFIPEFTTQDGPAHLYNARILNASLGPASPFAGTFEVAWQPLPNWAGHLTTMAALAVLPADQAGRAMTALTLIVLAASIVWLRWSVAGSKGLATASVLATLLGLNVTWLLGFTSFLLGAALMPATLAVWWGGREWFGPGRAAWLSILLVLGYFCHPISLGLTVVGLVVLAIFTPGMERVRRASWTMLAGIPLIPLGLAYRALTRSGGGLEPTWTHLAANPWSPRSWLSQLGWADPISLAAKTFRPFDASSWSLNAAVSPVFWAIAGLGLLAISSGWKRSDDRRGWLILAGLLLGGGLAGPDTFGARHGHYLPQRVALLGLVALVPWLDLGANRWSSRTGSAMLGFALLIQSAFVWDYALDCRDRLGQFVKAAKAMGSKKRVGTLLVGIKGRFRSNPLMHADCQFGVATDDVVWSNYETAHYYFPVKIRPGLDHPPAPDFERVALLDGPGEGPERARRWAELIEAHGESIDVIVEWCPTPDPRLDAINARAYDPTFVQGPVRVWKRRPTLSCEGSRE
jgi:hypothetical protein